MPTPEQVQEYQQLNQQLLNTLMRCMCHPARPNPYSGDHDIHEKRRLTLNGRDADIDLGIANLIWELWRCGAWTLGSCQEYHGGQAYIQFASHPLGGSQLATVAQTLGIQVTQTPDDPPAGMGLNTQQASLGRIVLTSTKARFAPASIGPLANALRTANDQANLPGSGGPPPV